MKAQSPQVRFAKIAFCVLVVLLIVYLGIQFCMKAYDFGYRVFTEPAVAEAPGQDVLIQIKEGMSEKDLGEELLEKGLIRDASLFAIQVRLSAYAKNMDPGVYTVNTSMTPKEMIVAIGKEAIERKKAKETESTQSTEVSNASAQEEGTTEVAEEE